MRRTLMDHLFVQGRTIPLLCVALAVGGCGERSSTPATTSNQINLTVTATEFSMDPAEIRLAAGQPVRLTFVNKGIIEHDWEARDLKATGVRVVSSPSGLSRRAADEAREKAAQGIPHPMAGPGQQMVVDFTPTGDGTYEVVCEVPGHKEAGMVGRLIVGAGGPPPMAQVGRAQRDGGQTTPSSAAPVNVERLPQPAIAPPVGSRAPQTTKVEIDVIERLAQLDDGVAYGFWTYGGSVPGPMLRIRQGDTVELTLRNPEANRVTHSIDLHAVTGPGGGAKFTQVAPGQEATFRFKALNPGVYVYHCASPPIPQHVASGMYGLIVVEPPEGLPPVDRELYVMQGDLYLEGARGDKGERPFSIDRMLDERPEYVVFNGAAGALTVDRALQAHVGETVRIFFGVGGPNLPSSFHLIGEIFDRVYAEGATEATTNVQTTLVPAGGAAIVEFRLDVPGDYVLVDHSLGRLAKGAAGILHVEGPDDAAVFLPMSSPIASPAGGTGH